MPAEQLENLVLVTSIEQPNYITAKLIVKSDWMEVKRLMAEPHHYTMLFSMTRAVPLDNYKIASAYSLQRVAERSPYLWHEHIETRLRTSWLGKAPETIQGEAEQLVELVNKIADESSRARFPVKEAGQS